MKAVGLGWVIGVEVVRQPSAEEPDRGAGGERQAPPSRPEVNYCRQKDEEYGGLPDEGIDGEGGEEAYGDVEQDQDEGSAEDDQVGNVVGIPEGLLEPGGVAGEEDSESQRPDEPPVPDLKPGGDLYSPQTEGAEQRDAQQHTGKLCSRHRLALWDVSYEPRCSSLHQIVRLSPFHEGNKEEAVLKRQRLDPGGIAGQVEIRLVDKKDGEDALHCGAQQQEDGGCLASGQAAGRPANLSGLRLAL